MSDVSEGRSDEDLWFLAPLPEEDDLDAVLPRAVRRAEPVSVVAEWTTAEARHAARLARAAARLGALDERLRRGPPGWRHRLALIEAEALSWQAGDRVGAERLALWMGLRLAGVQDDPAALARAGWAVRRLSGGPGPEADLMAFLERREGGEGGDRANAEDDLAPWGRAGSDAFEAWQSKMGGRAGGTLKDASAPHPITRAAMGFHLWPFPGTAGGRIEAAVVAARIAAEAGAGRGDRQGAVFAPLAMGGAEALRARGTAEARLPGWLAGLEAGCLGAMRHLDDIEAWSARAATEMASLSGCTPPTLPAIFAEWPLVSAPMAEPPSQRPSDP